jgi:hypothetical protein
MAARPGVSPPATITRRSLVVQSPLRPAAPARVRCEWRKNRRRRGRGRYTRRRSCPTATRSWRPRSRVRRRRQFYWGRCGGPAIRRRSPVEFVAPFGPNSFRRPPARFRWAAARPDHRRIVEADQGRAYAIQAARAHAKNWRFVGGIEQQGARGEAQIRIGHRIDRHQVEIALRQRPGIRAKRRQVDYAHFERRACSIKIASRFASDTPEFLPGDIAEAEHRRA